MSRRPRAGCYNFGCFGEVMHKLAAAMALVLLSGGCDQSLTVTPIRKVVAAQAQYAGQEVSVQGVVTDASRVPTTEIKLYSLEQEGARIVVITQGELPPLQQLLRVSGRVMPPSAVNGMLVRPRMAETERRVIK